MLIEYVDAALNHSHYDMIKDEEPFYGEVKALKGVWATGKSLEECRQNLKEVIERWILLSVKKDIPIPRLGGVEIKELDELTA